MTDPVRGEVREFWHADYIWEDIGRGSCEWVEKEQWDNRGWAREFLDRVILDIAPTHTGPTPAFIDDKFVLRHQIGLDALRALQDGWVAAWQEAQMAQHLYGSVLPRVPARSDQSRYAQWRATGRYPIPACVQDEIARLEDRRWTRPL